MLESLEYLIDGKRPLASHNERSWDLFISAYNDSARVKTIFETVSAARKYWWILPEYAYTPAEVAHLHDRIILSPGNEASIVRAGLRAANFHADRGCRICIDITGFMRPHILYLMAFLKATGLTEFDLIYTEPEQYARKADTEFSIGEDVQVESVSGFIGAHETDMTDDVLLLGVGYDHHLISHTTQAKESARVIQLHSFPSLSADMYHESILRLDRIWSERTNRATDEVFFTSANDPFVTAASVAETISTISKYRKITNLYLTPLATKAQAVGFGLYYLRELIGKPASIIFPNCSRYSRETSRGVGRSWIYPIKF